MSIRTRTSAAAVALMLTIGSCAYSTSTALLPTHLKTVAVPVFENATNEFTLERDITDAVIQRFVSDNHLRVVDERSADAVIRGKVTDYKNSVFGIVAGSSTPAYAQEYRVTIEVNVVFKDLVKNREIWSEDLVKTANYYVQDVPGDSARTELDGRKQAISKLADEILSKSIESW